MSQDSITHRVFRENVDIGAEMRTEEISELRTERTQGNSNSFHHEIPRGRAMEKDKLYRLKSEANKLSPIINIGKNGVTDSVVEELKKHIKANRLVKVKVLKSAEAEKDLKTIAEELAERSQSTLIEVRGRTVVLYR